MAARLVAALACLLMLNAQAAEAAAVCPISTSFDQPDQESEGGRTVTHQRPVRFDAAAIVFTERLHVNTDGNLRSYNAYDPWGSRCRTLADGADPLTSQCAMNTICNGANVRVRRADGTEDLIDYSRCTAFVEEFQRIRDANWLPADGSRVEFYAVETHGTSGHDRFVPCVDSNGFMISTASTMSGLNSGACAQEDYLDSAVPSVVVPKCWTRAYRERSASNARRCDRLLPATAALNLEPGDLVAVARHDGEGEVHFGVIGDTGPDLKLGEASMGLHMAIRGRPAPLTRRQTNALADGNRYDVLIFRGTRSAEPLTPENVAALQAAARARFEAWGGDPAAAREQLAACGG